MIVLSRRRRRNQLETQSEELIVIVIVITKHSRIQVQKVETYSTHKPTRASEPASSQKKKAGDDGS
jgi:hypothetical protein